METDNKLIIAYRQIVNKISIEVLEDLLLDHILINEGWDLYFVVDHTDISKFCFPISNNDFDNINKNAEKLSEDQISYNELFFKTKNPPIILKEYREELDGLISYIEYSKTKEINVRKFLDFYNWDNVNKEIINLQKHTSTSNDDLLSFIKNNYKNILSIALGLNSLAITRINKIFERLCLSNLKLNDSKIESSNEATNLYFKIYKFLMDNNNLSWRNRDIWIESPDYKLELLKQERCNKRDAKAITRVCLLNCNLSNEKKLLLYFSSAQKSYTLFKNSGIECFNKIINKRKVNLLRTVNHIYAYTLTKDNSKDFKERNTKTVKNINELLLLLKKIKGIEKELLQDTQLCDNCNSDTLVNNMCKHHTICNSLQKYSIKIHETTNEFSNISLAIRTDSIISLDIIQKLPKQSLIKLFNYVLDQNGFQNSLIDEFSSIFFLLETKLNFAKLLSDRCTTDFKLNLRVGIRQHVTCIYQIFPFNFTIQNEVLQGIKINLFNFIKDNRSNDENEKYIQLTKILNEFLNFINNNIYDDEIELIMNLIFLIFDDLSNIERIYNYYLEQKSLTSIKKEPSYERDLAYILAYVCKNIKKFNEGIELCIRYNAIYPEDQRFPHVISILIYEGLQIDSNLNYTIQDAIVFAKKAKSLNKDNDKENLAAILNNLAYFNSIKGDKESIVEAMNILLELKNVIAHNIWKPYFPEFFETESRVYFLYSKKVSTDLDEQILYLSNAYDSILTARRLNSYKTSYESSTLEILSELVAKNNEKQRNDY